MAYSGYQILVNGLRLPLIDNTSIFENGSYKSRKYFPILSEWIDANGTTHRVASPTEKTEISFTIKEHTYAQHVRLEPLLRNNENISLQYWDDKNAEYRTGTFYMEQVEAVASIATSDTIYYGSFDVTLREY